jgi:hypothetical protein
MSTRPVHPDEPRSQPDGAEHDVERLSVELKQQVQRAKARISEHMTEPRAFRPPKDED